MAKKKPITPYEDLTVRQQRFVDYYDGNGTQAAEKAGYSTPRQEAARLLSNVNIKAALRTRENRRRKGHIADRKDRQAFWTRVMRGEETQPAITGTDTDGNPVVEEIPPKMSDRLSASQLLGKSEADFTDKVALGSQGEEGDLDEININLVHSTRSDE